MAMFLRTLRLLFSSIFASGNFSSEFGFTVLQTAGILSQSSGLLARFMGEG
jgi:hypothetical protein